jgi:hypothetical protein
MKTCVVMSGHYRTFDQTYMSIRQMIEREESDVYCQLWSNDDTECQNVIDRLNPKTFSAVNSSLFPGKFESIEERIRHKNPKGPNQDKVAGNASMHYARNYAYSLVPKHKYDTVIYCRYDLIVGEFKILKVPDTIHTPVQESYEMISDIFAVMPMSMADSYFLYDNYERLHSTPFEPIFMDWLRDTKKKTPQQIEDNVKNRYCPHSLLARNILMTGSSFAIENIPVHIKR